MSTNLTGGSSLPSDGSAPPVTLALTVILLVFLFIGFFSIYVCRCLMDHLLRRRTPSGNPAAATSAADTGLPISLITSFPSFPYSTIKTFHKHKYTLECAICLLEFEDDSFLRLLTGCCHVFHQECIDLWLQSHKTCPVCRRNLDTASPEKPENGVVFSDDQESSLEDAIVIEVGDEPGERMSPEEKKSEAEAVEKFSRSHSTGHSLVRFKGEEEDKYTLRLPEDVKKTIVRGHNWTGSCVTFEELSRHSGNGGGFVEVSLSDQSRQNEQQRT